MNGGEVKGVESPAEPLEWRFSQVFGELSTGEEVQEVDMPLSSIKLVTILQLVIVGDTWFYSKELTKEITVDTGEILR